MYYIRISLPLSLSNSRLFGALAAVSGKRRHSVYLFQGLTTQIIMGHTCVQWRAGRANMRVRLTNILNQPSKQATLTQSLLPVHCLRLWPSIKPTIVLLFARKSYYPRLHQSSIPWPPSQTLK